MLITIHLLSGGWAEEHEVQRTFGARAAARGEIWDFRPCYYNMREPTMRRDEGN